MLSTVNGIKGCLEFQLCYYRPWSYLQELDAAGLIAVAPWLLPKGSRAPLCWSQSYADHSW